MTAVPLMRTAVFLLVSGALALGAARMKGGLFSAAFSVKGEVISGKYHEFLRWRNNRWLRRDW
jgi:hypothetical protein